MIELFYQFLLLVIGVKKKRITISVADLCIQPSIVNALRSDYENIQWLVVVGKSTASRAVELWAYRTGVFYMHN